MAILTSRTFLTTSLIALLNNFPSSAHPSPPPGSLSKRLGSTATSGIAGAVGPLFEDLFGAPPQCCNPTLYPHCRVVAAEDKSWQGCFDEPPKDAGYLFLQDDATTAACLIDLHYKQASRCISVAGSPCEAGKGTSQILNVWMGKERKLSSDDSLVLQAAANGMVGQTVSSGRSDHDGQSQGSVKVVRVGQNVAESGVDIRFGGDEQC